MDDASFEKAVRTLIDGARGNSQIMTGLRQIDEAIPQLRFTRALEILEKIQILWSQMTQAEKNALDWYTKIQPSFSKQELTDHWTKMQFRQVDKPKGKSSP